MKKIIYIYITLIVSVIIIYGCKKTPNGFLSAYIHYEQNPMFVPKGRTYLGPALNADGTSLPFTAKIVHFYDKSTGKIVDDILQKEYPVLVWTALYNSKTDTTLALINAKRTTENLPAITVLPSSGQLQTNYGALNLPAGEYQYDLQITNETGTKLYPKIGDFILQDTTTFDAVPALGTQYDHLFQVGNESVTGTAAAPTLTITRDGDSPNTVTIKILDKNGVPFNPKAGEIVRRPNTGVNPNPAYLQTMQDYALSYALTDNTMVFTYAFTPFPVTSLGNGYNYYYRIPTQFFHLDGQPDGKWSLNLRFPARFFVTGAYTVTMQMPDVTHTP